jgi:hypothetical protein
LREKLAAPRVTVYLMGGCANQIFQYAAGLALARRLGVDLKLDVSWYETATPDQPRMYSLGLFKGVDAGVVHSFWARSSAKRSFRTALRCRHFENAPRKCSLAVAQREARSHVRLACDELREAAAARAAPCTRDLPPRADFDAGERPVFVHVGARTDYVGTLSRSADGDYRAQP